MLTLITIIGVIYTYYWYKKNIYIDALRKRKKSKLNNTRAIRQAAPKQTYKCVVIHTDENACTAAKYLADRSILLDKAGPLPLSTCDGRICYCGYIRYDDRRIAARRRNIPGADYFISHSKNRRNRQDRRNPNLAAN
jgi:hypothetical protein